MKTNHDGLHRRFTAARLALSVILVTVATFGLATPAQACGIITHHHVAEAATNYLDSLHFYPDLVSLLKSYSGTVTYGAVFPDFGYASGHADFSNYAHDIYYNDFIAKYANHVKTIIRSPDLEDRKAIAFLFGIIAHNEADNVFHFNGFNEGNNAFLEEAKRQEKVLGISKILIEAGYEYDVDLFVRDQYEAFWIFGHYCNYWELPEKSKQAIASIYPTSYDLQIGELVEGFVAQNGFCVVESRHPSLAFAWLPWTQNNLKSYQYGGLDDMSIHIAQAWQKTWDWLNTYTPYTEVSQSSLAPNGIYTQPVTVTLTGTFSVNRQIIPNQNNEKPYAYLNTGYFDTSPFKTFYSINGGPDMEYTQPLNFDSDGIYKIAYYTVDKLENRGSVENLTINIDMAPPPQPPSTQTPPTPEPCVTYHVVKSGEKTGAIAHTYHLKWKEIYKANDLGMEEKPKAGDRLCIPKSNPARRGGPTNPQIQ